MYVCKHALIYVLSEYNFKRTERDLGTNNMGLELFYGFGVVYKNNATISDTNVR